MSKRVPYKKIDQAIDKIRLAMVEVEEKILPGTSSMIILGMVVSSILSHQSQSTQNSWLSLCGSVADEEREDRLAGKL